MRTDDPSPTFMERYLQAFWRALSGGLVFFVIAGCTQTAPSHIVVELPEDARLEDIPAGWWVRELSLPYIEDIRDEISERLHELGELRDEYVEERTTLVRVYRVPVSRQPLMTNDFFMIVREKRSGDAVWFEIPLGPEGMFWVNLMSFGGSVFESTTAEQLDWLHSGKKRSYHVATIESPGDRARLFLFGWGKMCMEIHLM